MPYKTAKTASRTSLVANIRGKVRDSRNPEMKQALMQVRHNKASSELMHPGQLETTEEVLRKHYFMAKAT